MDNAIVATEWKVTSDLALSPLTPNEIAERRALVINVIRNVMKEGRDYGIIPGTEKLSLWKAGAEKLCTFFGYSSRCLPVETVLDWTGKEHGEPFFFFRHRCEIRHGAILIAETEASCNSWEKKYRYREGKRTCPKCKKETIYRSKPRENDPPGKPMGFYCWTKKGGCGAQFVPDDKAITSQQVGLVKNDEIFDQVNTIQKMSEKRCFVGSTIIACNAGEFFALNLDDESDEDLGDVRPGMSVETGQPATIEEVKANGKIASSALRGDQGEIELEPQLKDDYSAKPNGETTTDRQAQPSPDDNAKSAILKYQPFVTWANQWVQGNGKEYARPSDPSLANMYHLLARIGKLGFAQVTEQNADDIKAALESYVKGKVDTSAEPVAA